MAATPLGALREESKRIWDWFVEVGDEEVEIEKERQSPEKCCDAKDEAEAIAAINTRLRFASLSLASKKAPMGELKGNF